MNTKTAYLRTVYFMLIFAILLSGCTRPKTTMTFDDFAVGIFGWESYETFSDTSPVFIQVGRNELVMAVPETFFAVSFGDNILNQSITAGIADKIADGEAYAARLRTSLYAIQEAMRNAPFSERFIDPSGRYLAALLPKGNSWYLGFVDLKAKSMFTICQQMQNCGSFITAKSASEIAQAMRDNGWKAIPASAVPAGVRSFFLNQMGWLAHAWFARINGVSASPMILPIGTFFIPQTILVPNDWQEH